MSLLTGHAEVLIVAHIDVSDDTVCRCCSFSYAIVYLKFAKICCSLQIQKFYFIVRLLIKFSMLSEIRAPTNLSATRY